MAILADADIELFQAQGFLKLPQLSTPEELSAMRAIYDELFESPDGANEGLRFDLAARESLAPVLPQALDPGKLRPAQRETAAWKNAGTILRQLLGEEPSWRGDHAILKPPRFGAPTPWHQDEAYWDPEAEHDSLSVWVPLQDVDERSGCMHFVPGSHRFEVLAHRPIGDDPKVHGLELAPGAFDAEWPIVAVPLLAGEATVHGGRTLHFAPSNATDIPRRAYIMMGGLPSRPRGTKREFPWQQRQREAGAPAS